MTEIRKRLSKLPDIRVSVRTLTSFRQGAPVDIDFSITGPDLATLSEFSEKLRLKAMEIPGIVDVDTTLKLDKPELLVSIDRERAAALGVSVQEIADTLRVAVGGDDRVSRYRDKSVDDAYDVELRLIGIDRHDSESISQLYVRTEPNSAQLNPISLASSSSVTSGLTRIDNVIRFDFGFAPARIDRLGRQRMVALRANIAPGFALSDRIVALKAAAAEVGLPIGFETYVLGRGRELERTLDEFRWTFVHRLGGAVRTSRASAYNSLYAATCRSLRIA
jgi:HAE1 family hydrophobic/amphiphilic exporter-1